MDYLSQYADAYRQADQWSTKAINYAANGDDSDGAGAAWAAAAQAQATLALAAAHLATAKED